MSNSIASYPWAAPAAQPPRMIAEAVKSIGVREVAGARHDPTILGWAREAGLAADYRADEVPWCGLFMAIVAIRAGKVPPVKPLWALSWAGFGQAAPTPMLGDVLVFRRPSGGHVGLYLGEDATAFHVLGGNQGDCVSILRVARDRLHAARRPLYSVQPASVRAHRMDRVAGGLSRNEA